MYGSGFGGAAESGAWLEAQFPRFLQLANVLQALRQRANNAQGRGVAVALVRPVVEQVDSLERDYREARARVSLANAGTRSQYVRLSAGFTLEGMQAVWEALFRRAQLLNDPVTELEQRVPRPAPGDVPPTTLESIGTIGKWAVLGGALLFAAKLVKEMR